jgi:hypothetical protein
MEGNWHSIYGVTWHVLDVHYEELFPGSSMGTGSSPGHGIPALLTAMSACT